MIMVGLGVCARALRRDGGPADRRCRCGDCRLRRTSCRRRRSGRRRAMDVMSIRPAAGPAGLSCAIRSSAASRAAALEVRRAAMSRRGRGEGREAVFGEIDRGDDEAPGGDAREQIAVAAAPAACAVRDNHQRVGRALRCGRIAEGGDGDLQIDGFRNLLEHAGEHGRHRLGLQVDVVGPALGGAGGGGVVDLDLAVAEAEGEDADLVWSARRVEGGALRRWRAGACAEHERGGDGCDGLAPACRNAAHVDVLFVGYGCPVRLLSMPGNGSHARACASGRRRGSTQTFR